MLRSFLRNIARWVERTNRPRLTLLFVIAVLYGPSLAQPFLLDDYRSLRLMEEYDAGKRPRLGLFEFIRDADDNAEKRSSGALLWWVSDDMRFCFLRPVPERLIYWQFQLFGRHPLGYRVISLLLYAIAVCAVLALFRKWGLDEPIARWAALLFAVASSNTLSVTWISQQCDLLAMLGVVAALLAAMRYAEGRSPAWLVSSLLCYGFALLSKEAAVPAAVLPLGLLLGRSNESENARQFGRVIIAALACLAIAAGYMVYHGRLAYGCNSVLMLDPLRAPLQYLAALPLRSIILLSSWLLPLNPVLVYTEARLRDQLIYTAVGLVFLLPLLVRLRWRLARDRSVLAFGLWALPFMLVLACAIPDSRIMMLPTIGLSVLGAVWLRRDPPAVEITRSEAAPDRAPCGGIRATAFGLLIVAQVLAGGMAQIFHVSFERASSETLLTAAAGFEQPSRRNCIFIFNNYWMLDALWSGDRLLQLAGPDAPYVTYLSPLMNMIPEVLGPRTLRLHAAADGQGVVAPFFTRSIAFGVMTRREVADGWTSRMNEFTATVHSSPEGRVMTVDFEFIDRLDSPRYGFYFLVPYKPPSRWKPDEAAPSQRAVGPRK